MNVVLNARHQRKQMLPWTASWNLVPKGNKNDDKILQHTGGNDQGNAGNPQDRNTPGVSGSASGPKTLKIYTNYDFVPGNRLILYDDFSVDNIGDFPAKWNTNGSGEVVTLDDSPDKWLKLSDRTIYVPDLPETLPNDYTIEFDMITTGLDSKHKFGRTFEINP